MHSDDDCTTRVIIFIEESLNIFQQGGNYVEKQIFINAEQGFRVKRVLYLQSKALFTPDTLLAKLELIY